jgi:hypothetical protein
LPVFDRKKITKGDVTPPFSKGRWGGILESYFLMDFVIDLNFGF